VAFDLALYKQRTGRLDLAGIDFAVFEEDPLDPPTLRCLQYMHDVEHHTVCYLRDLLVTSAHRDPEITSFMSFWVHEEYWHGEAIAEVLHRHGLAGDVERIGPMRHQLKLKDRLMPFTHMAGSAVAGPAFLAVLMTWGAVNEWTTQAGYGRLSQRAGHAVLAELLKRIMRQEGLHIDFYSSQAAARLNGDHRAQRLTRFALSRLWRPVGANVMPAEEVRHLITHLFSGEEGRAAAERIDRRIDRLPGLAGLGIVSRAARAARSAGRTSR
jgi:hypothetical protein